MPYRFAFYLCIRFDFNFSVIIASTMPRSLWLCSLENVRVRIEFELNAVSNGKTIDEVKALWPPANSDSSSATTWANNTLYHIRLSTVHASVCVYNCVCMCVYEFIKSFKFKPSLTGFHVSCILPLRHSSRISKRPFVYRSTNAWESVTVCAIAWLILIIHRPPVSVFQRCEYVHCFCALRLRVRTMCKCM